jgi:hypothetical protein
MDRLKKEKLIANIIRDGMAVYEKGEAHREA